MLNKFKQRILLFFKGIAMGGADVIPGVSGGTIAFITGIYERFIGALKNIDDQAIKLLFKGRIKSLIERIDGYFLLTLLIGMLTAVLSVAQLLKFLLENEPVFIWSFFFGLIVASAWVVSQHINRWNYLLALFLIMGALVAYFITNTNIIETPNTPIYIFFAGMVSIVAMILPGISGSFILVILGKYNIIISSMSSISNFIKAGVPAIFSGNWVAFQSAFGDVKILIIASFYIGAIVGLVTFSKVLSWLFYKFHDLTVAVLTGFLIGSLNKVWPWKETLEYHVNRHGEKEPLIEKNVLPTTFNIDVFMALGLMIGGFLIVFLLERTTSVNKKI